MKQQLILYIGVLMCFNAMAKSHDYELKKRQQFNKTPIIQQYQDDELKKRRELKKFQELKNLNEKPIIKQYREYAFSLMNPQIEVFLSEFPEDPKSQIIERYLLQLSFAATMYKFCKILKNLPEETDGQIPEEIKIVYPDVPLNALIYHFIVNNEIVENKHQLPYDDDFNAQQEWKYYLENLEDQMIKDLQKTHLKALSLQTN
jgi:hypothetical protein